jgi:2-polyprenyl-3-methyl-5-hydroxy-6-metoxy-1,4-benzoquinol methylase
MFGTFVDYYLLKLFVHGRNRATEAELDARAKSSNYDIASTRHYVERMRDEYFEAHFPVDPELSYLDVGCGNGRLSIGLSALGAKDVTGIDIVERHIDEADHQAARLLSGSKPVFHHADIHDWRPQRLFDVVLGAMEHIHDPAQFLKALRRLLKPEGRAFVSFEPFHSPIGDHMNEFFRLPIPWRGVLFSEKAILKLRSEYYRPTDPVSRYQDVAGGLNLMTFSQYLRWVEEAELNFTFHNFNPQLKHHRRLRLLGPVSDVLTSIPKVRDYFGVCIFSILKRNDCPTGS